MPVSDQSMAARSRRRLATFASFSALIVASAQVIAIGTQVPAATAATGLNVFVGYMDTHTVGFSANQPSPWPYTDPTSFVGSPCPRYPNDTTCWDAAALRLDNPGSTDITGVQVVATIGGRTYALWGSNLTVKAHGLLILTETGSQNSTNFDGSDYPPNAYNGGNVASCVNSGAIPAVNITIGGVTTKYVDSGQVLNGGGVDSGHCRNGTFVSGRMDESHPWLQIGPSASTVPSAPQSVIATGGSGSVSLSWSAPTSDGGAAITGYNIYRGTTSGGESATPIASNVGTPNYTDRSVTNGTQYFYTVAAVNSVGASAVSAEAAATPTAVQATAPSPPRNLTASGSTGSVRLSWTAPISDGGSAITGYSVYRGTLAGGESPTPVATRVTGTSFTDSALVNGTTYYYQVTAVNAVGTSTPSNEASATPQAAVPTAPQGLAASGGNGLITLSWSAPTSDGDSSITGYNVFRGTAPGAEPLTPIATGLTVTGYTDHTVVSGTTYYYKVTASNAVGPSPMSNEVSASPQVAATAPSPPQNLMASGSNGSVRLLWTAPTSNGGSAITSYNVYRGTAPGGESPTPAITGVTGTSFTDTSLANGTTYYYEVTAVNAVSPSTASNEASATPLATAPTVPQSLAASGGNGVLTLSWSAPASDGGSSITGYNVYRGMAPGAESTTPIATGVTLTGYTDSGVVNGTTYYYKVTATNAVGPSAMSNEASATPQVPATAGFVRRVASSVVNGTRTSTTLTVGTPGVNGGHSLVITLLLSSTSSISGAVSATDTASNSYVLARDVNDGSAGDRTVILVASHVHLLSAGGSISLAYPSSAETHVSVDEFAGVTGLDGSSAASATTTSFSSGSAPTTSQPTELLIGAVGNESGSAPSWAAGWTALPLLSLSSDHLETRYRVVTSIGSYAASGTVGGQWMAAIVTLKTS